MLRNTVQKTLKRKAAGSIGSTIVSGLQSLGSFLKPLALPLAVAGITHLATKDEQSQKAALAAEESASAARTRREEKDLEAKRQREQGYLDREQAAMLREEEARTRREEREQDILYQREQDRYDREQAALDRKREREEAEAERRAAMAAAAEERAAEEARTEALRARSGRNSGQEQILARKEAKAITTKLMNRYPLAFSAHPGYSRRVAETALAAILDPEDQADPSWTDRALASLEYDVKTVADQVEETQAPPSRSYSLSTAPELPSRSVGYNSRAPTQPARRAVIGSRPARGKSRTGGGLVITSRG